MKNLLVRVGSLAAAVALATVGAFADNVVKDGTRTISEEIVSVAAERELGDASVVNVVLANGGGVSFTTNMTLSKTYSLDGTGIVAVASGRRVEVSGNRLAAGAVGHVLVKRGAGTLALGGVGKAAGKRTRFIVEEGTISCNGDFWGGHSTADTNVTIDVRHGATYHHGSSHGVVGPVELTGATFLSASAGPDFWSDAALCGGVTAHAHETTSVVRMGYKGFLGHVDYTNCVFNVEEGARLLLDATLRNGMNKGATKAVACRLTKRGAGDLVIAKPGEWTGGTFLEDGTVHVAIAGAFGTGPVVVAGNVTLSVAAGVTLDLTNLRVDGVDGTHVLTLAGEGCVTLPETLPAGLSVEGNMGGIASVEPYKDGVLHLTGGIVTVNVPEGATLTVTAVESANVPVGFEAARPDIVKTGGGTLELPAGLAAAYGRLNVVEGFVSVADESSFGANVVTLSNGAGLRVRSSFTQTRIRISCAGAATLDIPDGVTFGVTKWLFKCPTSVITKMGGGTWQPDAFIKDTEGNTTYLNAGARWVVHEGRLKFAAGDMFCGYGEKPAIVLEAHEGAVIELAHVNVHTPVGDVVLRGGVMRAGYGQLDPAASPLEGGKIWKGFGLNGTVTVLPSADGRPSRLEARAVHAGHYNKTQTGFPTVFDVREDATFEVDAMICPGFGPYATVPPEIGSGVTKIGAGRVRFLKPLAITGLFAVEAGVAELDPGVVISEKATVRVGANAELVLDDKARIASKNDALAGICASAALWLDASRLVATNGETVACVPNLGTVGGTFVKPTGDLGRAAAPTFVVSGIGGRGSLSFDGKSALVTDVYTNYGAAASVFIVSRWTSWENAGGKGKWGGPFSMMARAPTALSNDLGDDNQAYGGLSFQHGADTIDTLYTFGGLSQAAISGVGFEVGRSYVTCSWRDAETGKGATAVWLANGAYQCVTGNLNTVHKMCEIDRVCVGGRLRMGCPQIFDDPSANRMYIGEIGEVLVFSRTLADAERAAVETYLRNKWMDAGLDVSDGIHRELAGAVKVSVPAGAEAAFVMNGAATDGALQGIVKSGAGTLRVGGGATGGLALRVGEGTLALRTGRLPSRVDVWVDAADAAARTLDADGRVTNVVNKGAAGGVFRRSPRSNATDVPFGPELKADGLNGNPVFAFDGDSCLALDAYTNRSAPRSLSVYFVGRRTTWELNSADAENGAGRGKWGGPFAFGCTTATRSDEGIPGIAMLEESSEKTTRVDLGNEMLSVSAPPTSEPYLFVLHSLTNAAMAAFEVDTTATSAVPRSANSDLASEPFAIDLVLLGSRVTTGGRPQWWGKGDLRNRCWFGDVAEFIATTEPLTVDEERDLFAYLRKKWLNKGDGPATPPEWLVGTPATPMTDADSMLAMADGAALEHAAGTLALGALETVGTVDWTRVWSGGDAADFPLFSVAGDVSLDTVEFTAAPFPAGEARILDWTGELVSTPTWNLRGDGSDGFRVGARGKSAWLLRAGLYIILR